MLAPIDVDRPSKSGLTALGAAIDSNAEEVCRLLLDYGADPQYRVKTDDPSQNKRLTPFERAVQNNYVTLAQLLNEKENIDPFGISAAGDTLDELVHGGVATSNLLDDGKEMLEYLHSLRAQWTVRQALQPACQSGSEPRKTDFGPL